MMLYLSLAVVYRDVNFPFIPVLSLELLNNDMLWPKHDDIPVSLTQ